MKNNLFTKTKLASSLSLILGVSAFSPVHAADEANAEKTVEVITVTGIRSSLAESTRIKRDASGIVDAISAEDIGKFPDTNLAESLQRITGVSISRSNGEGSRVTIRGFGAEKNLVTLNNRMLPTASASGQDKGTSRAFDFGNLASEAVKSLEVYKTGKANIATGGLGGTVNINTSKPLSNSPGLKVNIGGKAVHDTTNRRGDSVTPEASGLISYADDDNTFGVSLSASHQVRHSGNLSVSVADWTIKEYQADSLNMAPGGTIVNEPQIGELYAIPKAINTNWTDNERVRDNAQLTLQYRVLDNLLATVDYTYANNELSQQRGQKGAWAIGRNYDNVTFDTQHHIKNAILVTEDLNGTKDNTFEQQHVLQENTLKSTGLNLKYEMSDDLTLTLDAHHSTMKSLPNGPGYGGSQLKVAMAAPVGDRQTFDFTGDIPGTILEIDDSVKGNNDGIYNIADLGSQKTRIAYSDQANTIDQIKLIADYQFDNGSVLFGLERIEAEATQRFSYTNHNLGNWGVAFPGDIPDELIENFNMVGAFSDYDMSRFDQTGFRAKDVVALGRWAHESFGHEFSIDTKFGDDNKIVEDITAVYFQVQASAEFNGMPINVLAGIRYESTDITSTSLAQLPIALEWESAHSFHLETEDEFSFYSVSDSYDHLLPSLDFDIDLTDKLKARFSFNQTISRASYGQLRANGFSMSSYGPTPLGGASIGAKSNPGLVPLHSNNFDISFEYYIDDLSYVSAGFFEKRVNNFIGSTQIEENLFGLRDATAGPRSEAAAAELKTLGVTVEEEALFMMTVILDNPADFPNGVNDFAGADYSQLSKDYNVVANASDPEYKFLVTTPVNDKLANLHGFELAAQHFFGETGFGLSANYTIVRGDINYEDNLLNVSQFALTGLSDSANLVAMYDKDGLNVRVAYNWRDEYLAGTSRGTNRNPVYVEAYGQIDMSVSYNINESFNVFLQGINITDEDSRDHGRNTVQVWEVTDLGARYQVGARYKF